jgi:hypothetical protein
VTSLPVVTRGLLGGGLALVLAAGVVVGAVPELRTFLLYRLAPETARDLGFRVMRRDNGPAVHLLGTIHGDHLTTPAFGLEHLEAVIRNLNPSKLLLEMRPDQVAAGNVGDGPVEMPVSLLVARELGIPVDGLDWWERHDGARRTNDTRDDHMVANLLERLPISGVTLVLVGFSHVPEFVTRLGQAGFQEVALDTQEKAKLFTTGGRPWRFPPGTGEVMAGRIARDEDALSRETDPAWAERLRQVVAVRRAFLREVDRVGERAPGKP